MDFFKYCQGKKRKTLNFKSKGMFKWHSYWFFVVVTYEKKTNIPIIINSKIVHRKSFKL
jgi:hypothetical protein